MVRLSESFASSNPGASELITLKVSADYDPEQASIDNMEVLLQRGWSNPVNVTCIFDLPQFSEFIDNVNWPQLYRESIEEKEVEHA